MKKVWKVSFRVLCKKSPGNIVLEYLRYAGIIQVGGFGHNEHPPYEVMQKLGIVKDEALRENALYVTMECPSRSDGKIWAEMNVKRLKSFNVTAVAWLR